MKRCTSILVSLILLMVLAMPVIASPGSDPPERSLTPTDTPIVSVGSWVPTPTDIDIGKRIAALSVTHTTTSTGVIPGSSTESSTEPVVRIGLLGLLLLSLMLNIYQWLNSHTAREPPGKQPVNPADQDFPPEGWM